MARSESDAGVPPEFVYDPIGDAAVTDAACQNATIVFDPAPPKILVLADGSGGMFQPLSPGSATTIWDALRSAVLPIIQSHQDKADFGLGVLAGNPNALVCPVFNTVPMGLNNYQNIVSQYPTAGLRDDKLEAPIAQVLPMLPPMFTQAPGTGKNYILFLTAGEPDFCDDQSTVCSVDAAVAAISDLRTLGNITTYVFGRQSRTNADSCPAGLQAYANAGRALQIGPPCPGRDIYAECNKYLPWKTLAMSANKAPGESLVAYTAPGGAAKTYSPTTQDVAALESDLVALIPAKTCVLDVSNIDGQEIKIPANMVSMGKVKINGVDIPFDPTNGWSVVFPPEAQNGSILILNGAACATWQSPASTTMDLAMPCSSIIFE